MADNVHDHGNTPAAWTGVIIALIGFTAGALFTVMAEPVGVVASGVLILLGGVVGMAMRAMGLGKKLPAETRTAPDPAPQPEKVAA